MQGRRTVEEHGMLLDDIFKRVPYLGGCFFDALFRVFYIGRFACGDKRFHDEGLEQLKSHFLGQTALENLEVGSDDDNGTSGIVNTFTEQVLSETSLLTAQHLGKRFERAVARSGHGASAAAVVKQSVDSFLKHTLFVSDDDVGRFKLHKSSQTVVTVDDTSVQIIYVARCESAAVKLHHRADIRRDYGNCLKNHPFGAVAGKSERFDDLKTLYEAYLSLTLCGLKLGFEHFGQRVKVKLLKKLLDRLGAHADAEIVFVFFVIFFILCLA